MALAQTIASITSRVMALKPVRVYLQYLDKGGPLLSAGLSYQALFAVFAAITVGFSIAGFAIKSNPEFEQAFLTLLSSNLPGLIDTGNGGAIDPDALFASGILASLGIVAAVGLLFTALGWLASGREAVRRIFGLPNEPGNIVLAIVKDLGLAVAFGVAIVASAALSVLSTTALTWAFESIGIDNRSTIATIGARAVGLLLVLVLDAVVLGVFYRVLSGIRIPWKQLGQGVLIAGIALGTLQALGSSLLAGATRNPLLASFAVIIGLLVWFNLICQVLLIGASWIAVSSDDDGVDLTGARRKGRKGSSEPSGVGAAL